MQITTERKPLEQVEADALIVPVFEGGKESRFGAESLAASGEVTGKPLELTLIHNPPGVKAKRVVLGGVGKAEKYDPALLRRMTGAAVRMLKSKSVKRVAILLDGEYAGADFAEAAVEGVLLGNFDPDRHQTSEKKSLDALAIVGPGALDDAIQRGRITAEAQNFARELANEPANRMTPLRSPMRP